MNSRTLPFTLVESDEPSILNVDQLYRQAAPLIDRRTARGLRSPRALIVTVAVLAKRAGSTRVEEVADWAKLRRRELRVLFGAKQPQMPHHTIWSRMLDLAENGGDYLWLVDANQPTLRAERALRFDPAGVTAGWFAPPVDFTTARTVDTGRGCSEARILPASRRLAGESAWPYVAQVFPLAYRATEPQTGEVMTAVRAGVPRAPATVLDATDVLTVTRELQGRTEHVDECGV